MKKVPRRIAALLASMVLLGALGILGYRYLNTSATGSIKQVNNITTDQESERTSLVEARGEVIAFNHPEDWTVNADQQVKNTSREQFILSNSDITNSKRLVITVNTFTKLSEVSAYQFRKLSSNSYELSVEQVDQVEATLFTKKDGHELTLFLPHGTDLVTLSLTASGGEIDKSELLDIASSIKWL